MAFLEPNNTFSQLAVNAKLETVDSFLKELDNIVDFNQLRPLLKKNGIGTKNSCGVKAYDSVLMRPLRNQPSPIFSLNSNF